MRAARVGIVEDENIAVCNIGEFVDHRLGGERHNSDEDRQAGLALHQRLAGFSVVQPVAGVVRLGDGGVEGGAEQRGVHLVSQFFQPALQHRERDRIHRHQLSCS